MVVGPWRNELSGVLATEKNAAEHAASIQLARLKGTVVNQKEPLRPGLGLLTPRKRTAPAAAATMKTSHIQAEKAACVLAGAANEAVAEAVVEVRVRDRAGQGRNRQHRRGLEQRAPGFFQSVVSGAQEGASPEMQ